MERDKYIKGTVSEIFQVIIHAKIAISNSQRYTEKICLNQV